MTESNTRSLILLHVIVFIFGFTGVLGKLISLPAIQLVWLRMIIAFLSIAGFMLFSKQSFAVTKAHLLSYLGIGVIIATHWFTFFQSIKVSTVSIALVCLSTATIFTAFLEPLFYKRKIKSYEVLLGLIVIAGLFAIFKFEFQYKLGIILSIVCAFLASLFTVLNGQLTQSRNPPSISLYEMLGGAIALSAFLFFFEPSAYHIQTISKSDWFYLLVLGIVCTGFAFVASVYIMRQITPFTVALTINLEPVYGIILALLFFGENEKMTPGFYIGGSIILIAVLSNAYFKRRERTRARTRAKNYNDKLNA